MATNIDELVVRIKADTKQLNEALDKVKKKTKGTGESGKKGFAGFTAQLGKMKGAAIGAAAAIGGITIAVKQIAQVGMAFEDLQISLNTVFGGIRGGQDAFDAVIDFAKTTPFQIEDVTKAFIRLKSAGLEPDIEMLKTFGDAASIAGNATEAFAALVKIASKATGGGLGLEELEQLETQGIAVYPILQKQLGLTRDKIAEFGKSTKGAALVIKALQKGLKETTGGTMAARMDNLSTKSSNLEIAFKQLALEIFQGGLGNMLKGLTDRMSGFVDSITNALRKMNEAKAVTENVSSAVLRASRDEAMVAAGTTGHAGKMAKERVKTSGGFNAVVEAEMARLQAEKDAIVQLTKPLRGKGENQKAFKLRVRNFKANDADADRAVIQARMDAIQAFVDQRAINVELKSKPATEEDLSSQVDDIELENAIVKAEGPLNKLLEDAMALKHPFAEITQALNDLTLMEGAVGEDGKTPLFKPEQIELIRKHLGMLKTDIQEGLDAEKVSGLTEEFGHLESAVASVKDPIAEMEQTHKDLTELFTSGEPLAKTFVFGDMSEDEIRESLARYKDSINDLINPAEEAAKTLGDTLSQAVTSISLQFTNNFVNALMDGKNALSTFKDFAKNIVSQIISIFLQMAIVNKILNAVFSGVNGGKGLGLDTIELAGGGAYQKGQPTLVGERGPELMIPNTSGTVMNNMNTKNAMGGGDTIIVNQSLNFSTGVVGTVRAEINKMMPTIAEVSKSAVLDASRRGGNYRKGLLGSA